MPFNWLIKFSTVSQTFIKLWNVRCFGIFPIERLIFNGAVQGRLIMSLQLKSILILTEGKTWNYSWEKIIIQWLNNKIYQPCNH